MPYPSVREAAEEHREHQARILTAIEHHLSNGLIESTIIWSPQRRVIDVAHGADRVRQGHVIRSMSPTEDL